MAIWTRKITTLKARSHKKLFVCQILWERGDSSCLLLYLSAVVTQWWSFLSHALPYPWPTVTFVAKLDQTCRKSMEKNVSTSPRDSAYEYEGIPEYKLYTVKCGLQSRHSYVSIVERFLCQCTTFPSFHPQKPTNVEETKVPNLPTQSSPLPGGFWLFTPNHALLGGVAQTRLEVLHSIAFGHHTLPAMGSLRPIC